MRSNLSLAYIRRRATANMRATVRIERVNPPTFDELTNTATAGSRTQIYTGIARIWEVTGPQVVAVGEEEIPLQTTQLSIPWNASPVPRRDDEVEVITSDTDSALVGKRFRIISVAKAGDMRPTRRFTVQTIEASRQWS